MEVSTFDDVLLELSAFAKRLERFIEVEHHFVQGSLVVGLSSKFGSGKTTFLKMWRTLGSQQCDPTEVLEYLSALPGVMSVRWWFKIFLTGGGLRVEENESELDVMTKVGLIDKGADPSRSDSDEFHQGWGDSTTSRFVQIHEKIEQIFQWSQ